MTNGVQDMQPESERNKAVVRRFHKEVIEHWGINSLPSVVASLRAK